jgi:hypothetical protein
MEKPVRSVYTSHDFQQWRQTRSLELTPKFQRRGVWTAGARSFSWAGKTFDGLYTNEQDFINEYGFSTEVFHGISDPEVLSVFAHLNTYSVPLNAQELRNGKFFGWFKQSVYDLAHEHLEFWRRQGIFSERGLARMLEVELTSELVIAQLDGMQDKKKSIDVFYQELDDEYRGRQLQERRFRAILDDISDTFENGLRDTEFSRVPLFYTLFCVIYHFRYGLPGIRKNSPHKELSRSERLSLVEAVDTSSTLVASGRAGTRLRGDAAEFAEACLRQTDNIRPRQDRFAFVYARAFGG